MTASRNDHPDETVLARYREKGLAGRVGFGSAPAVVVVDFIIGFTDTDSPLASDLDAEVAATTTVLDAARTRKAPVFFTTTAYDEELREAGLFPLKVPSLGTLVRGSRWVEVDPRLGRRSDEPLIEKSYASAFFATSLADDLRAAGVDTVIVTGCTTSGCVRATVVDALQHGFRAIVPRQCVGDRSPEQHAANLVDIDGKYGDVVDLDDVLTHLQRPDGTP
jgi:nicotinamidase-related amidase